MAKRNFADSEEAEIRKIYESGKSARSIAQAYGLSHHISIVSALRRQNANMRSVSERNRRYAFNTNKFDIIDAETAYVWGFIYADGHVYRNNLIVKLSAKDKDQIERIKSFLESECPIKYITVSKKYKQCTIEVSDVHMAKRLRQLGIVTGRGNFISAIQHLPEEHVNHWIRGLFDGDGSINIAKSTNQPVVRFCGHQEKLLWIANTLTNRIGSRVVTKLQKHNTANLYYLRYSGRNLALKIYEYMYDGAHDGFYMPRKRQIFDDLPHGKYISIHDSGGKITGQKLIQE